MIVCVCIYVCVCVHVCVCVPSGTVLGCSVRTYVRVFQGISGRQSNDRVVYEQMPIRQRAAMSGEGSREKLRE